MVEKIILASLLFVAGAAVAQQQAQPGGIESSPAYAVATRETVGTYDQTRERDIDTTIPETVRRFCESDRIEAKQKCSAGMRAWKADRRKKKALADAAAASGDSPRPTKK